MRRTALVCVDGLSVGLLAFYVKQIFLQADELSPVMLFDTGLNLPARDDFQGFARKYFLLSCS